MTVLLSKYYICTRFTDGRANDMYCGDWRGVCVQVRNMLRLGKLQVQITVYERDKTRTHYTVIGEYIAHNMPAEQYNSTLNAVMRSIKH